MTSPTRTSQITKALRAEGLPLELVCYRSDGYFAFIYDDADTYETESVCVYRLSDLTTAQWLETGRSFATTIRA